MNKSKFQEAVEAAAAMTQEERNQVFGQHRFREIMPKELVDIYHDTIVEKCAEICDNHLGGTLFAEAIRKLKRKP